MSDVVGRRAFLAASAASLLRAAQRRYLIDTHVHLFARDQVRFPYHAQATYRPPAQPLEDYLPFVRSAGIAHTIIVHPEPYQDDHRYLEFCFANEPSPFFFKGTCLFDPIAPGTPSRMADLVHKNRGRIVALRIHENREAGVPPTTSGPIRDRDLKHPAMRTTWRKAHELGLAIQMHMIPLHAPEVASLAAEFADTPVIIDHLARAGQGTPEQYRRVLDMAKLRNVRMKFSGVNYSSHQPSPHKDVKDLVRRTYDAFGPDRMIWGGLGMNTAEFEQNTAMFDFMFDFASEADRARICGGTAAKLFGFAGG
jgi:predicted TIM-barrel fold metal-dependent hydrolase